MQHVPLARGNSVYGNAARSEGDGQGENQTQRGDAPSRAKRTRGEMSKPSDDPRRLPLRAAYRGPESANSTTSDMHARRVDGSKYTHTSEGIIVHAHAAHAGTPKARSAQTQVGQASTHRMITRNGHHTCVPVVDRSTESSTPRSGGPNTESGTRT
ncbi:hypothetical protein HYPSUDRAFT_206574 [Hypholoma sublateritium FD-334 SS-4]|uniref:Uncharacterized protein n=1 Tax=Hypholoma sublateritium (strain FD-334 SS-4) TaxID=945553 RepID=A0A0D2KQV1_HYPSF|nr:hypothetical protein HYPSUDRAFT_206574 [Hypholoma sublateritium FD-334 SS-4]